uniref:GCF C-terminal domain-containing protein n=1 Tax=Strigamia maritima TaxID=126957 RepID=T1JJW7_STRMM
MSFRKPKRNFRQRNTKNDSDEENNGDTDTFKTQGTSGSSEMSTVQTEAPAKTTDKRKAVSNKKITKVEKNPVMPTGLPLSFDNEADEEEDSEVFKVKKSSYSRRLMKQLERQRKKKTHDKGDTLPSLPSEEKKIDEVRDGGVNEQKKFTFNPTVMNGEDVEEIFLEPESLSGDEKETKSSDPFRKILESGSIPDAAMIHAARKRRQKAREMSEFISLDEPETEKNNSRLIRDDDNDRSDDDDEEHGGRISFSAVKAPLAKDRAREALLAMTQKDEEGATDEEVDEEIERWEEEQIRKGVSIPQVTPIQHPSLYNSFALYQNVEPSTFKTFNNDPYVPPKKMPEIQINISAPPPPPPPPLIPATNKFTMTLESYKNNLIERLDSRRQLCRDRERERDAIQDDLITRGNRILESEEASPNVSRAFTFYQAMRGYVTDLVECLDEEKMGKIIHLETSFLQLLKQRATRLVQRSQQDTRDQSDEFMALLTHKKLHDPIDVSNRDNGAKARRVAEREGRRTRRRRARETWSQTVIHYEGMSSDDEEMEADTVQFNTEKDRLLDEASHVFDDVVEDYHSISLIKNRFEQWKETYPESYRNAFIGLCIPKVFFPFVRLQLIFWNFLEFMFLFFSFNKKKETRDFEEFAWFESLMFYGYNEKQSLDKIKDDSDSMVIPNIVERIILPRLTEFAESVWNPISTSQTLRFVNLVRRLVNEYPNIHGKNKKTLALLAAVVKRMRKTLDDDVYMPPYPKSVLDNKLSGANAFFQRQNWTCVKILRNFLSWQGILNDEILQEVALDGLLTRYLLWAMNISPFGKDTMEKAKMVTAIIPRSWFAKRESDTTIAQLELFCKYLKCVAETMGKLPGADKISVLENVEEVIKMLVTLGALNHAADVANQFSIKDISLKKE